MFKRSRRKIVAAIMGALLLLMIAILTCVYAVSYIETERENNEMLARYTQSFELTKQPGGRDGEGQQDGFKPDGEEDPGFERDGGRRPPNERAFAASAFYSVVFSEAGEPVSVDNGINDAKSGEELTALAQTVLSQGRDTGRADGLLYRVDRQADYTLVAFLDDAVTENNMNILLRQILLTGGVAVVVIFFVAVLLARRIGRPLEENDRRQRQFVSDAGHELKTPVAVIGANTELLARQIGENEWLSNIAYETERMSALVTDLLDLSRAENAALPTEPVDLSRLVAGEALPFESVAFEAGLRIRTEIAEGIRVEGNPSGLRQLTSILLDNAIRHAQGGEEVALTLTRDHRTAALTVENHGEPIPEDLREKLFERFYRADEARTGDDGHYGLGLAIAKAICDAHHGTISVDCRDGLVLFTARLPLQK